MTTLLKMNEPGPRTRHGGNVFKGGGGIKQGVKFEHLLKNESGELDRARFLTGHFPLGIREHLPKHLPKERELRYFTFLREPADRTLSHYFGIGEKDGGLGRTEEAWTSAATEREPRSTTRSRAAICTTTCRRGCCRGCPEPFGEVDDAMLEQAKHNLREELAFFGLTERFDESLVLAKQRLGLRSILYRTSGRVNTGPPARRRGPRTSCAGRRALQPLRHRALPLRQGALRQRPRAPAARLRDRARRAARRQGRRRDRPRRADPPPASMATSTTWRMLLHARATSMRHEFELAEQLPSSGRSSTSTLSVTRILAALGRIHASGKRTPGRDAETAMRTIRDVGTGRARRPPKRRPGRRPARRARSQAAIGRRKRRPTAAHGLPGKLRTTTQSGSSETELSRKSQNG